MFFNSTAADRHPTVFPTAGQRERTFLSVKNCIAYKFRFRNRRHQRLRNNKSSLLLSHWLRVCAFAASGGIKIHGVVSGLWHLTGVFEGIEKWGMPNVHRTERLCSGFVVLISTSGMFDRGSMDGARKVKPFHFQSFPVGCDCRIS